MLERLSITLPAMCAALCAPAHAAAETPDQIIVEADRRDLPLSDAPVFGVALGGQTLLDAGVFTLNDLVEELPGVSRGRDFAASVNLLDCRGLTLLLNGQGACALVVDGRQLIGRFDPPLFAISDAVFTTGPAPSYSGALAGALVINTHKPGEAFEAHGLVSAGGNGFLRGQGYVSGKVADNLSLGLYAASERFDGNFINEFRGEPVNFVDGDTNIRIRAVYAPFDGAEIDAQFRAGRSLAGAAPHSFVSVDDPNLRPAPTSSRLGRSRTETVGATVAGRFDLGPLTLASTTDFSHRFETSRQDLDFSNVAQNPFGAFGEGGSAGTSGQDIDAWSHSTRLSYANTPDRRFGAHMGVDYHRVRTLFPGRFKLDGETLSDDDFFAPSNPAPVIFDQDREDVLEIVAGVAGFDLDLAEGWNLAALARIERQDNRNVNRLTGEILERTDTSFPFKATLSHARGPALFFASYGAATRGPVFNSPGVPAARKETMRTAEIGAKAALLDGRLNVSLLGFHGRVSDFQIFALLDAAQQVFNLERVRIVGAEGSLDFRPGERLRLGANFALVDSDVRQASLRPDLVGLETPKTLRTDVNLSAAYNQPLTDELRFVANVFGSWRGNRNWEPEIGAIEGPAFTLDLGVGLDWKNYSLRAVGENVTDASSYDIFFSTITGGRRDAFGAFTPPGLWRVELRGRF